MAGYRLARKQWPIENFPEQEQQLGLAGLLFSVAQECRSWMAQLIADSETICICPSLSAIILIVRTTALQAICPHCHRVSARIHSRYTRIVADLLWQGVSVELELYTRRYRCQNSFYTHRIFCERLPYVVAPYSRKTVV